MSTIFQVIRDIRRSRRETAAAFERYAAQLDADTTAKAKLDQRLAFIGERLTRKDQ